MKIKLLNPECKPERSSEHAAGFDVYPNIDKPLFISGNEVTKVPLGFIAEIPEGFVGLLVPRSGMAVKHGVIIANTMGVIDSDYRGEVVAALVIRPDHIGGHQIHPGDRIAQLVVVPHYQGDIQLVEELSETVRAEGGFGSTGE